METSLTLLERLVAKPTDQDWQRLVDLYQPLLRAWLLRAGVAPDDLDDLSQDILLVVFREVGGFDHRHAGAFRGWLKMILLHRIRNFFRSRRHAPQAAGGSAVLECLAQLEAPQDELNAFWDREHNYFLAQRAMERVRGEVAAVTWQAFRRYVVDGQPPTQVAPELGLSLNSVLLAKSRVLKRLRKELVGLVEGAVTHELPRPASDGALDS
jgi:RNA polymerase sigma-70 factor (ECF subfamily)